jgi:hypothetical protein
MFYLKTNINGDNLMIVIVLTGFIEFMLFISGLMTLGAMLGVFVYRFPGTEEQRIVYYRFLIVFGIAGFVYAAYILGG